MTDTDLPDDLLALERARVDARRALDEFVRTVEIRQRAEFPGDDQIIERRQWPSVDNERHAVLQAGYKAAADAVRAHPMLVAADAERGLWRLEEKIRKAVPQVLVTTEVVSPATKDTPALERVVTLLGGVEVEQQHA